MMKKFVTKMAIFLVLITSILFSGLNLPSTPRASRSLLFAHRKKDSLLLHQEGPRIIFVGGSNLSFGLNSHEIKAALNLNPINTGIHADIGLKYMLENTLEYLHGGDIVIVAAEYSHFFKPYDAVSDELLRTVVDVVPEKKKLLSFRQKLKLLGFIPTFSCTKFKFSEYWGFKESDVYGVSSFNEYGDADAHWNLESVGYSPITITDAFHKDVVKGLNVFTNAATNKGARVYITFPCLDEISFRNSEKKILQVERVLNEGGFSILGNARRYSMPAEMMFNTHYHLNKKGVEQRTRFFIEDFKRVTKCKAMPVQKAVANL